MKWATRLKPAPVQFPNGGGLKAMATKKSQIKNLEHQKIDLEAKIAHAKVDERHKNKTAQPSKKVNNGR